MDNALIAEALINQNYKGEIRLIGVTLLNDKLDTPQLAAAAVRYVYAENAGVAFHVLSRLQQRNFSSATIVSVAREILDRIEQAWLNRLATDPIGASLLNLMGKILHISTPEMANAIRSVKIKNALASAVKKAKKGQSPYYTIDAGIVLEADAIAVLDKIGPLYFARTSVKFNVNSGTRDSYRQAEAMHVVYMNGDKTLHLYKNRQVVQELLNIITKGESKAITVKNMTAVIQGYFEKGVLMSGHQKAGAIDIAIVGDAATGVPPMSSQQQNVMMQIAKTVTGFNALLEKSPPHIHIKFK
jgi:hypothetical protein